MTTSDFGPSSRRTTMTTTGLIQRSAAACMAGAAVIHFAVAGPHFSEWWLHGLFFLVVGAMQAVWALLCWQPTKTAVLLGGVVLNLGVLVVWAASRTTGLPFGPSAGVAEPIGVADTVSAVLEVVAGALAVLVLVRSAGGTTPTRVGVASGRILVGAVAALVLIVSGTAIAVPGGHEHTTDDAGGDTHSHANGERHDMEELPDVSGATADQTQAAGALVEKTEAATAKYRDVGVAKAAGFDIEAAIAKRLKLLDRKKPGATAKLADAPFKSLHVPNLANREDGNLVDPDAPETLIYSRDGSGTIYLVGVMFTAEKTEPPASYQPYLRWHFHEKCVGKGTKVDTDDGSCPPGTTLRASGYMTHVWFVAADQLQYAFAMSAPTPQLRAHQASLD